MTQASHSGRSSTYGATLGRPDRHLREGEFVALRGDHRHFGHVLAVSAANDPQVLVSWHNWEGKDVSLHLESELQRPAS